MERLELENNYGLVISMVELLYHQILAQIGMKSNFHISSELSSRCLKEVTWRAVHKFASFGGFLHLPIVLRH